MSEADLAAEARRLAADCGRRLTERGLTLAVAESSSGGLLASLITDVPGSSACFRGGLVPYSYETLESLLALDRGSLETHGAVSEETAGAMAAAARRAVGTDLALAVTGIAGPGGGTAAKPEGLTFVAVADSSGATCERHVLPGERLERKLRSAIAALALLLRVTESRG